MDHVKKTLEKCKREGGLMDTLSIDILLANLNNSAIHIFPCYSPVDGVNLL